MRRTAVGLPRTFALAVALAGSHSFAQEFHLSRDFDVRQNPSGPWSLRMAGIPLGQNCRLPAGGGVPELRGWGCFSSYDASITKMVSEPSSGWQDAQLDDVVVHVSSEPLYPGPMSISWTAPSTGVVSISGAAWAAGFAEGRDAGWTMTLTGSRLQTLAGQGLINGVRRGDPLALFQNCAAAGVDLGSVPVVAGDHVIFTAYPLTTFGHFMGVSFGVSYCTQPGPSISSHPTSAVHCLGGSAAFSVQASGSGVLTYRWQIETAPGEWLTLGSDPAPLPCGGSASASPPDASSASIAVRGCPGPFTIRGVVSDGCVQTVTQRATLTICRPDLNCDSAVDFNDYLEFLNLFNANDPLVDFNADGSIDFNDYLEFLNLFNAGC